MGAFVMPIAFLCMAYASLSPNINDQIQPLLPALKSNWLIAHVITCFIGYAGFAIAFCLSLMVFLRRESKRGRTSIWTRIPNFQLLDELTHKMVMLGFSVLDPGHNHRCGVGQLSLGAILGMGSQRDLVTHHLVHLCHLSACPFHAGMAGAKDRGPLAGWVWSRIIHVFRC
jgi:hypothetical protein